ncbi:MAG TPA: 50S ribosomal protein L29 [Patescibacteria group bacterium]|nr:50S ribosomal protein L29 [Patescibacteria group bacterium]
MKKKEITELKGKTIKELFKMANSKKEEAKKTAVSVAAGKEKNLKVLKNARREIAQILTIIKEKEIMEKLQPKKEEEPKKK